MVNAWDEKYAMEEYRFGKEPNTFFKSVLDTLDAGKILIPAAGEGRDAVYAATKGWDVYAFDLSSDLLRACIPQHCIAARFALFGSLDFIFIRRVIFIGI